MNYIDQAELGKIAAMLEEIEYTVELTDPRLSQITRLRLLSEPGYPFWDLSYCWGRLADGTAVRVTLPVWRFSKRNLRGSLLEMCKDAKVYGRGIGIFDVVDAFQG